jgi:hypothetical protein
MVVVQQCSNIWKFSVHYVVNGLVISVHNIALKK